MNNKIKLILADDHVLFAKALCSLLSEFPQINVIGFAEDGEELLDFIKLHQPDVVLLDIRMPQMDGRKAHKIIKQKFPSVKVIILTSYTDYYWLAQFVIDGAHGFLRKNAEPDELIAAIEAVYSGNYYYDKKVSNEVIPALIREANRFFRDMNLNAMEVEILQQVCEEKSTSDIAKKMSLSEKAVGYHRSNIYKKTNIKSVAGLVKFAVKHGITQVEE